MVGPKICTQTRFVGIITSTIHPYACFSIKSIVSQDLGVYRHVPVFNHRCPCMILSCIQNDTNMLLILSWTQLSRTWTGYNYYGDYDDLRRI